MRRMAFQPEILVVQPVVAAVCQLLVGLSILVLIMPLLGQAAAPSLVLCLIPLALQLGLAVGFGWILGVSHVYFRDTVQVVTAGLQAWFYLTPIVYTLEIAPASLRPWLALNPMCSIIEAFRGFAVGDVVPWGGLAYSAVWVLGALALGAFAIERARPEIPDLV